MLRRLLDRIGLAEIPPVTAEGLSGLFGAYVRRVPYENLTAQLGAPEPLGEMRLLMQILHGGRGGYCFEINGALCRLLAMLGFEVERREGYVGGRDDPWLTNHLVPVVHLDGMAFICDAGLGDGLVEPVPLTPGMHGEAPLQWTLERVDGGWWVGHHPYGTVAGFRIRDGAVGLDTFDPHHARLAGEPNSPFVQTFVAFLPARDRITVLRARTLTVRGPAVDTRQVLPDQAAFAAALREVFGIDPQLIDLDRLWEQARAQHEHHVSPSTATR